MRGASSGGFTLVEVMVSSIILVIVASGIIGGIISALKAQANASDHYRATCIARNRIQHARTISFDSFPLMVESNREIDLDGNLSQEGDFRRSTIVTNVATNSVSISVQVWYPVAPGRLSTAPVEVQTMIANGM